MGRPGAARLAGHGRGGTSRADGLRRPPRGAVRPVAGRHGPRRAVAVPLTSLELLNLWLLDPLDACRAVEAAYRAGRVPLQSAEGFIRQVIGWREYIWGMYWLRAGEWRADDALAPSRPLPPVFWTGETDAECLRACVSDVRERAYAHHIQRLMVLGNMMLLLGVTPVGGGGVVPGGVHRRRRMGDGAERRRHGDVGRRRRDHDQALRRGRQLHPSHERLLRALRARAARPAR